MTRFGLMAALLLAATGAAQAQSYPSRPITMIVPYGPGGPSDVMARLVMEPMQQSLGQPVVIQNITGASGTIGVTRAVRAAPDGYTVVLGNWPTHVVNAATYELPYDIVADSEPVALMPSNPYVLLGRADLPATSLKDLITWLKANPEKATQGTAGPGSGQHVSGVYFQNVTGAKYQFVPYRSGSADIIRDVMGGHIDFTFDQAISSLGHLRNDKLKAFAVTSKTRLAAAPNIPTVDEAGAPGVYITTWYGLWAPKGTPKEAVDKLNAAVRHALADPTVRKRLLESGQDIPTPEQQSAESLRAHHTAEVAKWTKIIRDANITAK